MTQRKSQPYFGSPVAHPDQKLVGTWTSTLDKQADDISQGVDMLRRGFKPSMTTLPDHMELKLRYGKRVRGTLLVDSLAIIGPNKKVRFLLTEWKKTILWVAIVEIDAEDKMNVEVRKNPRDPQRTKNIVKLAA